ncbi:Intersectin-2 [Coemansia sp. RSA 1822]|nr:Intersectin-2 [Coemansia sp. RSA 1822]
MRATPIYACQAENVGEVSFATTDLLTNIGTSAEDGWLIGTVQRTSQRGLFPAVYTELTPESGDDIVFLRKLQSEGLLSSTLQLEAFANGLDNGHVSTTATRNFSSVTSTTNNCSTVNKSENYNYSYTTSSDNRNNSSSVSSNHVSYSSSAIQAPHVPAKPNLNRLAITEPTHASRALPPPIPTKPKFTASSPRTNTARTTSSQTMSPATSFSQSLGSRTTSDQDSSRNNSTDQETLRMREADAARAWENAHLVKKPTTLDGSREVSRLFNGLGSTTRSTTSVNAPRVSSPRPAVAAQSAVSKHTALSTAEQIDLDSERNAAASWEAKHGIGKSQSRGGSSTAVNRTPPSVRVAHKPVVTSSSRSVVTSPRVVVSNNPRPAVTTSPRSVVSNSPRPVVSSNPKPIATRSTYAAPPAPPLPEKSFASSTSNNSTSSQTVSSQRSVQRSNPATENDAPALPHNSSRSAVMDELLLKRKPVPSINPSTANDAPALPYSPARASFVKPAPKPVEASVQPMPRNLISQINNQTPRSLNSTSGFSDSFEPATQVTLRPQHSSPAFPVMNATRSAVVGRPTPLAPSSSSSSFQRSYTSSVTKSEESSTSITATSGIPLTYSREVKGALPFTAQSLQNQHQQLQHSYTKTSSSSSSFTQHTSHVNGTGMSAIPSDALNRYAALFHTLDEQDGRLGYVSSNTVRDTVARSNLPDAQLRRIWQLADRNLNGQFGPGEFNILMHLVDCALRNDPIPDYLPVDLLHAAYA